MENNSRTITWEAHEHYYQEKGGDWYFALGIITLSVVVVSLILNNTLLALLLLLSGFALAIIGAKRPSIIPISVSSRGIKVNEESYPFSVIESYHINEDYHLGSQLIIKTKKHLFPLIVLPLPKDRIDEVDDFLATKIKEEDLQESFLMLLLEKFGF